MNDFLAKMIVAALVIFTSVVKINKIPTKE